MKDVTIRELQKKDLQNGFLTSLDALQKASELDDKVASNICKKVEGDPDHIIVVAELDGKIVGCATIIIEQKFIHNGGRAAHIEDVAVDTKYQGAAVGKKLVNHALDIASSRGCYKSILHCTNNLAMFYKRLGFRNSGNAMRFDHN